MRRDVQRAPTKAKLRPPPLIASAPPCSPAQNNCMLTPLILTNIKCASETPCSC